MNTYALHCVERTTGAESTRRFPGIDADDAVTQANNAGYMVGKTRLVYTDRPPVEVGADAVRVNLARNRDVGSLMRSAWGMWIASVLVLAIGFLIPPGQRNYGDFGPEYLVNLNQVHLRIIFILLGGFLYISSTISAGLARVIRNLPTMP